MLSQLPFLPSCQQLSFLMVSEQGQDQGTKSEWGARACGAGFNGEPRQRSKQEKSYCNATFYKLKINAEVQDEHVLKF